MRLTNGGREITSIAQWQEFAPPKRPALQWKPGRSAYELANAWCAASPPHILAQLQTLLDSHADTSGGEIVEGFPEHPIHFDNHGGEPRNADLALRAQIAGEPLAITIEAKADETFGLCVGDVLADAVDRSLSARSNGVKRVEGLAAALLPSRMGVRPALPRLAGLRYQLLTAVAGTLAFADQIGARRAVLIIHEFLTDATDDQLHERNQRDLDSFLRRLSGGVVPALPQAELCGPFLVPGRPLWTAPAGLYIGKITTCLRGVDLSDEVLLPDRS